MSGGSWDYVFLKIEAAANDLQAAGQSPERRALGKALARFVNPLNAIEWNDSGDGWRVRRVDGTFYANEESEAVEIRRALGDGAAAFVLSEVINQALIVRAKLQLEIDRAEAARDVSPHK